MDLLNELENDLAVAFLVEKKHRAKIDSQEIPALLDKVRKVLQPISKEENPFGKRRGETARSV